METKTHQYFELNRKNVGAFAYLCCPSRAGNTTVAWPGVELYLVGCLWTSGCMFKTAPGRLRSWGGITDAGSGASQKTNNGEGS